LDPEFAVSSFLKTLRERQYSSKTLRSYSVDLSQLSGFLKQRNLDIEAVDKSVLRAYLGQINNLKSYKNASLLRKHASLRSFFKHLFNTGMIKQNPSQRLSSPRKEWRVPHFLNPEDIEALIREICLVKDPVAAARNRAWIELVYSSGLRVAELESLNIEDIDFWNNTVRVIGKGNKERIVPVGGSAVTAIRDYLKKKGEKVGPSNKEARPLFTNLYQKARLTTRGMHLILLEGARKAGITKKVSPHVIRHTFATHMLNAGCDMRSIQEMLGHKNLSTTQIYAHVTTERLRKVYDKSHPRS
jgi:integrase/recombinase XerC